MCPTLSTTAHPPTRSTLRQLPLTRTRSRLLICLSTVQRAHPCAPAQHCTHACQWLRTSSHAHPPAHTHAHPLITAHMRANCSTHTAFAHAMCLPTVKHTRSRAGAQHCTHACQLLSTPSRTCVPNARSALPKGLPRHLDRS